MTLTEYLQKFYIEEGSHFEIVKKFIDKNRNTIIKEAQNYLDNYEKGIIPTYATDLEKIYNAINITQVISEAAATNE